MAVAGTLKLVFSILSQGCIVRVRYRLGASKYFILDNRVFLNHRILYFQQHRILE